LLVVFAARASLFTRIDINQQVADKKKTETRNNGVRVEVHVVEVLRKIIPWFEK